MLDSGHRADGISSISGIFRQKNGQELAKNEFGLIKIVDGILYFRYNPIGELPIGIAKQCVDHRLQMVGETSYPSLFDIRPVKKFTKEARDYLANEGSKNVTASALIVNSAVLKMAANFFISVNKPKIPTRMFTDEVAAVKWLQEWVNHS